MVDLIGPFADSSDHVVFSLQARAWGSGRQHFVGSFSSAIDAARAYDKAILKLGGAGPKSASRLNFPLTDYDLQEIASMNFPVVSSGLGRW